MSFRVILVRPLAGNSETGETYSTLEDLAFAWNIPDNKPLTLEELQNEINKKTEWSVDDSDDLVHFKIEEFDPESIRGSFCGRIFNTIEERNTHESSCQYCIECYENGESE